MSAVVSIWRQLTTIPFVCSYWTALDLAAFGLRHQVRFDFQVFFPQFVLSEWPCLACQGSERRVVLSVWDLVSHGHVLRSFHWVWKLFRSLKRLVCNWQKLYFQARHENNLLKVRQVEIKWGKVSICEVVRSKLIKARTLRVSWGRGETTRQVS